MYRERMHFDLCLMEKRNGRILAVIENKVKSLPKMDQLDKYDKTILKHNKDENAIRLLLSLYHGNLLSHGRWECCDYEEYLEALKTIAPMVSKGYHSSVYDDYCQMVVALTEFVDNWSNINWTKPYAEIISGKEDNEYRELRINDLRHKIIYSELSDDLKHRIICREENRNADGTYSMPNGVEINSAFTNSLGIVSAKTEVCKDYYLGIQVQGNQYRHFIEWHDRQPNMNVIQTVLDKDPFFFSHFPHHNKKTCCYKPSFFYHYIKTDGMLTIDVINQMEKDILYCIDIRKQHYQ